MEIREEAGDYHRIEAREMAGHRRLRKGATQAESTQNSNSKPLFSFSKEIAPASTLLFQKTLAMKRNQPNERILDELRPGDLSL